MDRRRRRDIHRADGFDCFVQRGGADGNKGGISQGELTGGGNLNVTGERWLSRGLMHATMR